MGPELIRVGYVPSVYPSCPSERLLTCLDPTIQLFNFMSALLQITQRIQLVSYHRFGSPTDAVHGDHRRNLSLLGALRTRQLDMCLLPLVVTTDRFEHLGFSQPLAMVRWSLVIAESKDATFTTEKHFIFHPFTKDVWAASTSLVLFGLVASELLHKFHLPRSQTKIPWSLYWLVVSECILGVFAGLYASTMRAIATTMQQGAVPFDDLQGLTFALESKRYRLVMDRLDDFRFAYINSSNTVLFQNLRRALLKHQPIVALNKHKACRMVAERKNLVYIDVTNNIHAACGTVCGLQVINLGEGPLEVAAYAFPKKSPLIEQTSFYASALQQYHDTVLSRMFRHSKGFCLHSQNTFASETPIPFRSLDDLFWFYIAGLTACTAILLTENIKRWTFNFDVYT